APLAEHATIAVVEAVHRGVVLVVGTHGSERENLPVCMVPACAMNRIVGGNRCDDEVRLAAGGLPDTIPRCVGKTKTSWNTDALVEVVEVVEHAGDQVANAVVVFEHPEPRYFASFPQGGLCKPRDNGGFG